MYSGELEVQAKRKAVAVLQDEINRLERNIDLKMHLVEE